MDQSIIVYTVFRVCHSDSLYNLSVAECEVESMQWAWGFNEGKQVGLRLISDRIATAFKLHNCRQIPCVPAVAPAN